MTPEAPPARTAFEVADRLKNAGTWDVFAERSRRYEIHLNGRKVEQVRGPIHLEGYGLRVFRAREPGLGIGFQASTDLTEEGVRATLADAEALAGYGMFPAKSVDLPSTVSLAADEVRDPRLWDRPMETLEEYIAALLAPFDSIRDVEPSFGSVRATLTETTLANSQGLRLTYPHTFVNFELAVKAHGGPEGRPPGEYWVTDSARRLEPERLPDLVADWCRYARDVRKATEPPTGQMPVLLPASVLSGILPTVIGARFTGAARLREIAPEIGAAWGGENLTLYDDGRVPWSVAAGPIDDEGFPQRRRTLLSHGRVTELLYDLRHAGAFGTSSTGNGSRGRDSFFTDWRRFIHPPANTSSTIVIEPGSGGSDEELIEAAGEGVWVQQLGWAIPDTMSGAFGGEVRIGYRIRHGKLAEPVRGGTVGGTVIAPPGHSSLLAGLQAIGSRSTLSEQVASPSLLATSLTVSGKG